MPSPRQPDYFPLPSAPRPPMCPHCGSPMRLITIEPSPHYTNLDRWSYGCDCGERTDNLVSRPSMSPGEV